MTNAVPDRSDLTRPKVRPADRLGFTLVIAALAHVALILGITFSVAAPSDLSKTLEITLATFNSEEAPDKADYLAQHNQQGSGSLDHKLNPTTTEKAIFQDNEVREITQPSTLMPPPAEQQTPRATLATRSLQQQRTSVQQQQDQPAPPQELAPQANEELSAQIASLEADLAREMQEYAKRPRTHRLNSASTMADISAQYRDEWRRKVELIGNQNYPEEARRQRLYGSLRLLAVVRRDGTLQEVQLLESSGHATLDQAAMRIVRLAAPYPPFTGDLRQNYDQIEIIRTWRFERGDQLSSQ